MKNTVLLRLCLLSGEALSLHCLFSFWSKDLHSYQWCSFNSGGGQSLVLTARQSTVLGMPSKNVVFKISEAEAVFPPKLRCCWHIGLKQISSLWRSLKSWIVLASWKGLSGKCLVALFIAAAKYFGRAGALARFLLYARAKHLILDTAMTHSSVQLSGKCSVQQPSGGTLCDLWLGPIPGA